MKTLIAFLAALLALPITLAAQKEDNVWIYAGNRINFNTTPPTVTPVGIDYVAEQNITSVADRDGNLVYWLNGTSLYNSKDEVVYSVPTDNGSYFYGLSIVPFPYRENVYLFVYPNAVHGTMVMNIVDGSKDLLHPAIIEDYAVFPYSSGFWYQDGMPMFFQKYGSRDFWLLYSYNGYIWVYALTADGFQYTDNKYALPILDGLPMYLDGCEMTPDRSKIIATDYYWRPVFIDLDTKTGVINHINPIDIRSMSSYAFSSGNKYMIYSNDSRMYRIPVDAFATISTDEEFKAHSELIGDAGCDIGDIKFLASGGVYYMRNDGSGYLGMVRDSDSDHPTLDNNALKLANTNYSSFFWAFPKTYCYPYGFTAEHQCGGEVQFSYNEDDGSVSSLLWDFGDGNTSTDLAPTHVYEANGQYTVSITVIYNTTDKPTRTITEDVVVTNVMKKLVIVRE